MRIAFCSDLHVEYHLEIVGLIAEATKALAPDLLILAGDVCPDLRRLEASLRLIRSGAECPIAFVPGNHELWCGGAEGGGPNSRRRYYESIPYVAGRAGAIPLGINAKTVGEVTLVGVTGWYDYSLRDPDLDREIDDQTYRTKSYGELQSSDLSQVHWPDDDDEALTDKALCDHMLELLTRQLTEADEHAPAHPVVAVTHMLPHRSLLGELPADAAVEQRFREAYMGSERLGELLLGHPRVARILCGHTHALRRCSLPGVAGEVICQTGPIGYPREIEGDLAEHVQARLQVFEL